MLLAWVSTPVLYAAEYFGLLHSKYDIQLVGMSRNGLHMHIDLGPLTYTHDTARLVLTTLNALVICLIRRAVARRYGRRTSALFAVLSCTQFHLPFWMGRTLPNMFALIPGTFNSPH